MSIVYGMSNEAYHALPALGSSGLRDFLVSPGHYFGRNLDPARPERAETAAMAMGTLVHCAALEPDAVASRYIVKPPGHDGRTKEGKAWAAAIPSGATVIDAEQFVTAGRMAAALRRLPDVAALLDSGRAEVSAFCTDVATGVQCKARPDVMSRAGDGVILVDVKTCQDASQDGFAKSVWNFRYDLQDAWYSMVLAACEMPVLGFVFAAVEKDYPHAAAAYMLDDETREAARIEVRAALAAFAECERTGHWPGYSTAIELLTLPPWAKR